MLMHDVCHMYSMVQETSKYYFLVLHNMYI